MDGYEILRRRPRQGEEQFELLARIFVSEVDGDPTRYTDSTADAPDIYVYGFKTITNFGGRSELSNEVIVEISRATETPTASATDTPSPTATDTPEPTATDTPEPTCEAVTVWSADMSVVDYGTGAIGASSANLLSNQGGSAGLEAVWLWYYAPDRELYLSFTTTIDTTRTDTSCGRSHCRPP